MKRFFGMILILFILYFGVQMIFKFTAKGFEAEYQIKENDINYKIKEVYTSNQKGEKNNYFLTIQNDKTTFYFQTYQDFKKAERIIKEIKTYHSERYECLLPIFRGDKLLVDIMCKVDGVTKYYHDLKGQDTGLDTFASTLNEIGYHSEDWVDQTTGENHESIVTFYQDNLVKGHYLGYQTYDGIFAMNNTSLKSLYKVKLFDNDIYDMSISGLVGKYYVVANYNSDYDFNSFYLVDLKNYKKQMIEYRESISFDAYVQGIVGNSMYVFDPSSKKQYEVNTKSKTIVETGNADTQIKYYNRGEWSKVSAYDAVNKRLYFNDYEVTNEFNGYERVDQVGNTLSGYYYFYQKNGNNYDVYRSNIMSKEDKTYLFTTSRIDQVHYIDDYVYYLNGDTIFYYHDSVGTRKLYTYSEYRFNNKLKFEVYK